MKDYFCAYYTDSEDITNYMASMINVEENDIILEPSAGNGLFIDTLLNLNKKIHIDGLDIDKEAISVMSEKYKNNPFVTIRETDTLFDAELDKYQQTNLLIKNTDTLMDSELDYFSNIGGYYTKVIGNPPYGAWQDYEKRDLLKKKYSGQYVKETYSLFLLRCISVLKDKGKLSFIIPDTFLFLAMHQKLREILLINTKINEILIFPSKFFPGVSFGYSNLSIITLERCDKKTSLENNIKIYKGFKSSSEFELLHSKGKKIPSYIQKYELNQKNILDTAQHRFVITDSIEKNVLETSNISLGDVANIVTGFYSGDNTRFIKAKDKNIRGANNYEVVNPNLISDKISLYGIEDMDEVYIPYVKSSSKTKYVQKEDEWFVRWDKNTVDFYQKNKKSRFQNSNYYFKKGICIPMVKARVINAFLMENRVFDQSIVGIFPKDEEKILYVLALMNSDAVNNIIHVINPTANNSSNYVKQIPYKEPDEIERRNIETKVTKILKYLKTGRIEEADKLHSEINTFFNSLYGIPNNNS